MPVCPLCQGRVRKSDVECDEGDSLWECDNCDVEILISSRG